METLREGRRGRRWAKKEKSNLGKEAIELHKKLRGKIEIRGKFLIKDAHDISIAYTPGVAEVCRAIHADREKAFEYTSKWNNIAIVTDGTRTLGLGKLGAEAALPVMEGKALLYKQFGNVDAFPICLATTNIDEIISTVKNIAPVFGGINVEDIETPKVLEIVDRLDAELDIPVFHDDQHGTAVVTLAALLNAMRLTGREPKSTSVIVAGAGSAGYGIVKILKEVGVQDITAIDSQGVISKARDLTTMNKYKLELVEMTDRDGSKGSLSSLVDAVRGRDVFVGVSGMKGLLTAEMVTSMNKDSIVLPLTNPDPEIHPRLAAKSGAKVIATGSYKFENRANNALVFPFTMRAILDNRVRTINQRLLVAVANALADLVSRGSLTPFNILPDLMDKRIQPAVTAAVKSVSK